jgi:tetratricopeptide (TPR) repeat protein
MTHRYFFILLSMLLLYGCSAQKETMTETDVFYADNKERAVMEHFLNGTAAEAKGDYASAVEEFLLALELKKDPGIYYVLAKNYFYINKLGPALENSRAAVQLDDNKIEYKILLADVYSTANMADSAAIILEKITAEDSTQISALYKLARLYEKSRPMGAIEIYNKIIAVVGPEWNVLLHIAEIHEKLGNMAEAAAAIEQLLVIDPSNTAIQKMLSELYVRSGQYDKALLVLQDIIELTPDDMDARERKAAVFISQDDWEKAAAEYEYIINKPEIPLDIKLRIGISYFNKSLSDSSLTPLTKSLFQKMDEDTTDWRIKMYLGAVALNENNDSLAINNFKNVTELANWNSDAWVQLGGLYFDNQRYEEAVILMEQAIEMFPEDFAVNFILGLSLAQSGENEESKPYLKKAVKLRPADLNAISAYAFTLSQLKENTEAEEYLKKALLLNPDDVNLLGTLGLIYDSEERWAECDSVYERALEIDSTNALINNNYAYSLSERDLQLERALEMAKIAIAAEPENSSYLDTMGWIYFKLGDYDEAQKYIEKAIEIGGEKSVMLEHLGDIVFKAGQKAYAMELWEKAFKLDESNSKLKEKLDRGEI